MNSCLIQGYIYNIIDIFKEELSIKKERELFFKAKNLCLEELFILESKTTSETKNILRILRDFLEDPNINSKTLELIENGFSRGYSYIKAVDNYLENLKDSKLKKIVNNFNNVRDFMLIKMYGQKLKNLPKKDLVLVVDELSSFLLLNIPSNVKGIITKKEPLKPFLKTLINEKDLLVIVSKEDYKNDTFVLLDGENNKILFEKKESAKTEKKQCHKENFQVYLNVSSISVIDDEIKELIDGIGILKTEYLFLGKGYVDKKEQISIYRDILREMYPKRVKIRLFDFKNDKKPYFLRDDLSYEFNLCDYLYEEQLEAILEANEGLGNAEIIIPQINAVSEFRQAVAVIKIIYKNNKCKELLPKIGIMLETKEAFDNLSTFKEESFMVINASELSKELLGFDKNELNNYKNYNNNVIEIIKIVSAFCRKNNIDYLITGDLLGNKTILNMLIQRRERAFSIPKSFLNKTLEVINNIEIK